MSQRAQTLSACIILDCVFLYQAQLLLGPSEGAVYSLNEMQKWAWGKPGMSKRAQTWSPCIFLDHVFLCEAQLLLGPSEGAIYMVNEMQK